MQTVLMDFETRVQEINEYFLFVESLIDGRMKLVKSEDNSEQKIRVIDRDLAKTLKANGFL
jgi:hypothetical protein